IIMDPPSYGRGPTGEVWKIEESIDEFIQLTEKVLSDKPLFFLINSYTTGLSPLSMTYIADIRIKPTRGGHSEAMEIALPVKSSGALLPCGASVRYEFD
ncbi:MAG: SAM-dependent methyltransferase, partial [Clostridia bacterium]|nr:SAM-dependent methyltransferase [Clostridia bacterium]